MKIGIILHSQTGHTLFVAEKIKGNLSANGHLVSIEKLKVLGEAKPGMKDIKFDTLPDLTKYDAYVFASPVEGFSLSSAMMGYLKQISSIIDKKTACFVTQHFPYPWMGGNRSVKQMKNVLISKGAIVCDKGVINWVNAKNREKQIFKLVEKFGNIFS